MRIDSVAHGNRQLVQEVKRVLGLVRVVLDDAFDLVVKFCWQLVLLEYFVEDDFLLVLDCKLGFLV